MALTRCLCLTLIVGMLGLRPSAGIRTGAPNPGTWWGSQQARDIRDKTRKAVAAGNFAAAAALYRRGYELAAANGEKIGAVHMLFGYASALFGQFQYRAALAAYLEARREAVAAGDILDCGVIDLNLSSLYLQVWDFDSAMRAAERSRAALPSLVRPYFEASLLLHLGRLHEILGDGQASGFYLQGIDAARRQANIALESKGWDYLGAGRLVAGDLAAAERALCESFRLRSLFDRAELPFSWALLGALKLEQRDFDAAALFTGRAIAAADVVNASYPRYLLLHQRGEIRLARGQTGAALADFAEAVKLASLWRREVPPSISALTASNIELEKRVFDSFIGLAAERAIQRHDRATLEQSLAAVDLNRAASLRQSLAFAESWHAKLDPQYWEIQAQLRAESARLLKAGLKRSSLSDQLDLRLSEMEAETKLRISANKAEKIHAQISLIDFQNGLSQAELVLVFHLGPRASYLWAVTREDATLHRLPPADVFRPEIERFREAVRQGGNGAEKLAMALYRRLFGDLAAKAAEKPRWLLSVDDALFDLPFAALVTDTSGGRRYLVEEHSLEVIPGALPVTSATGQPEANGWFLGVGDPIYNLADTRLTQRPFRGWWAEASSAETGPGLLNRLPASGIEIETSARAWHGSTVLLRGAEATRAQFLALAGRGPAIVHLAAHVVIPPGRRDNALIAMGLGPAQEPEFLAVSDIAGVHIPGAIVVMSGCETGAGDIQAGAGLLGLTRAWQSAGAGAVVATAWPVTDSTGAIFSSFYRHLHYAAPAEALRQSQVEMLRSESWRAAPSYWSAYQISGGAQ